MFLNFKNEMTDKKCTYRMGTVLKKQETPSYIEAINTGFPNYFGLKKPWWPNS